MLVFLVKTYEIHPEDIFSLFLDLVLYSFWICPLCVYFEGIKLFPKI